LTVLVTRLAIRKVRPDSRSRQRSKHHRKSGSKYGALHDFLRALLGRHLEGFDQIYRLIFRQCLPWRHTDPAAVVVVAQIGVRRCSVLTIIYDWCAWLIERDALAVSIRIRAIEEQCQPGVLELEWLLGPVGRIVMHERPIFLGRHHHVRSNALWCRDPAEFTASSLRHGE